MTENYTELETNSIKGFYPLSGRQTAKSSATISSAITPINKNTNTLITGCRNSMLITGEINLTDLSEIVNNIIHVINQHAKLLDTVGNELALRPLKNDVGEMFNVLSLTYPHETILQK